MKKGYRKGSFTIEAVILVSFVLLLMLTVMKYGIRSFQESVTREPLESLENWDAVEHFYKIQVIEELGEEIKND